MNDTRSMALLCLTHKQIIYTWNRPWTWPDIFFFNMRLLPSYVFSAGIDFILTLIPVFPFRHLATQRQPTITTRVALANSFRWTTRRVAPWEGKKPDTNEDFQKRFMTWSVIVHFFQSICGEIPPGEVEAGLPGAQWAVSTSQKRTSSLKKYNACLGFVKIC